MRFCSVGLKTMPGTKPPPSIRTFLKVYGSDVAAAASGAAEMTRATTAALTLSAVASAAASCLRMTILPCTPHRPAHVCPDGTRMRWLGRARIDGSTWEGPCQPLPRRTPARRYAPGRSHDPRSSYGLAQVALGAIVPPAVLPRNPKVTEPFAGIDPF